MLIELRCGSRGRAEALVSSCLGGSSQYISADMQILRQLLRSLPLCAYSFVLSLPLPLCLYPFPSRGCNRPPSVQRKIKSSDSSSSGERCKEPRGAPMAPHSHLLSLSPSTMSHTFTANPFLSLSPCPPPSPHAGPQSSRTRRSGGRRCPATTSRPRPWTCVYGTHRTKVRSPCLRNGRRPTPRPEWFISSSK